MLLRAEAQGLTGAWYTTNMFLFLPVASCQNILAKFAIPKTEDCRDLVSIGYVKLGYGRVRLQCKKRLAVFLSAAGMSLTKLFLTGNNLPRPSPRKV